MAGLNSSVPNPQRLVVHQQSRILEIDFDNGKSFRLSFELLRVYSPSAEVRGHGKGQETLQTGKRDVGISAVEAVGNYAIKPIFSDGHESGLYSWDYLYWLGENEPTLWDDYLRRLDEAGASRDGAASAATSAATTDSGAPLVAREAKRGGCG